MWLYIPKEYCPSSPESLDSISEFGLFFQNLELSVSLSGKATQRPYSWRGWKTRPWMKLLSGVTLQPSTAAAGMELWIQSASVFPASRLVAQANEQESRKGHGQGCSLKPAELFAKYDQGIFLSKTSQDSFLTSSCQSYSENFPKWGSMHSGECFRQEMWEAPILEKESSSWRTPRATEYKNPDQSHAQKAKGLPVEHLSAQTKTWGTPTVDAISDRKNKYAQGGTPIAMQASSWATPQAFDMNDCQRSAEALARAKTKGGCKNLREEVSSWPTPRKVDTEDGNENNVEYSNGHFSEIRKSTQVRYGAKLCNAAASWPTPCSTEVRQGVQDRSRGKKGSQESLTTIVLKEFECNNPTGPSAPVKQNNGSDSSKSAQTSPQPLKKRLNPKFVEHLMGMPPGWSLPIPIDQNDYKRWETESAHLLRLLHSASYGNE